MDSRFFVVFADILLPLALGMALRRWGLSKDILRLIIKANVVGVASFLSLVSFWSVHVTRELLWLPVSILPICFLPVLIFYLFQKNRFTNPLDQGSYLISMMLGNIGTLAGLCAYVLYGEVGFAYVQLIAVPQIHLLSAGADFLSVPEEPFHKSPGPGKLPDFHDAGQHRHSGGPLCLCTVWRSGLCLCTAHCSAPDSSAFCRC